MDDGITSSTGLKPLTVSTENKTIFVNLTIISLSVTLKQVSLGVHVVSSLLVKTLFLFPSAKQLNRQRYHAKYPKVT